MDLGLTAQFVVSVTVILVVVHMMLGGTAYLILLERKVAAWTQDRIGPNRTNFSFGLLPFKGKHFGLGQALADGVKLMFKEEYDPPGVDRVLFILAPALVVIPALIGWAIIPWGGYYWFPAMTLPDLLGGAEIGGLVAITVAPISIGVVYLLAVSSLAVYGVVLGAYASNNKYSFLGGLRATAQMLSYEIPMGLCVLMMIMTLGTADAGKMVIAQAGGGLVWGDVWGIIMHPLIAVIFFICLLAETNRAPFDLAEAEQELVGGFHTEYSSMKWALFFLAEYMNMITGCAIFAVMFLGGWDIIPFVHELPWVAGGAPGAEGLWATWWGGLLIVLIKFGVLVTKVVLLLFVMMWIRWTLPRLRFDQLMKLAWRGLIPITLVMLLVTGFVVFLLPRWIQPWALLIGNVLVTVGAAFIAPRLPQGPPVNRRVKLRGSRFSPLVEEPQPA